MRHTDLYLRTDTPDRLIFAHPHRNGAIFAVVAAAGWIAITWAAGPRWGWHLFCGVLVTIGLYAASRRHELDFDLRARTYRLVKGSWPSPITSHGSLDDLRGVVLTQGWYRSQGRRCRIWTVSLLFHSPRQPVSVLATDREPQARRYFEHWAEALRVDAIDRTL